MSSKPTIQAGLLLRKVLYCPHDCYSRFNFSWSDL